MVKSHKLLEFLKGWHYFQLIFYYNGQRIGNQSFAKASLLHRGYKKLNVLPIV